MESVLDFLEEHIHYLDKILYLWRMNTYIGEVLVKTIVFICTFFYDITVGFMDSTQIFCEDLGFFVRNIVEETLNIVEFGETVVEQFISGIITVFFQIWTLVSNLISTVRSITLGGIVEILAFIKLIVSAIHLLGVLTYHIICFLPRSIIFLVNCIIWLVMRGYIYLSNITPSEIDIEMFKPPEIVVLTLGLTMAYMIWTNIAYICKAISSGIKIAFEATRKTFNKLWTGQIFVTTRISNALKTTMGIEQVQDTRCVVCLDRPRKVIYMPCRHFCACYYCDFRLKSCPLCRTKIKNKIQVYT